MRNIMYLFPGWENISIGEILRQRVQKVKEEEDTKEEEEDMELPREKVDMVADLMVKGELINQVSDSYQQYVLVRPLILSSIPSQCHQVYKSIHVVRCS